MKNITIYQQSHHGMNNNYDALLESGFLKARSKNDRLFSVAIIKDQKKEAENLAYRELLSYKRLKGSNKKGDYRYIRSSGEKMVVCRVFYNGLTGCYNK